MPNLRETDFEHAHQVPIPKYAMKYKPPNADGRKIAAIHTEASTGYLPRKQNFCLKKKVRQKKN